MLPSDGLGVSDDRVGDIWWPVSGWEIGGAVVRGRGVPGDDLGVSDDRVGGI